MYTSTLSAKGWLVIPRELRDTYGLKTGSRIQVVEYGGSLGLVPVPEDPIAALDGMLLHGPSLPDDLLIELQKERSRDA